MATGTIKKAAAKPAAKKTPPKKATATEFTVSAPDATEIFLVGDFSNWKVGEHKMKKSKAGLWKTNVQLKPGRYEYRFVIDGNWCSDPENPSREPNPFGSENSLLTVS